MSQINEKVVEIIVEKLNCEASEVTPEANFSSDLGADSLDTVELIILAGYLCLITPIYIMEYPERIINIHPALLPSFGGQGMYGDRVHAAVIASGAKESGITIHLVDEDYDHGRHLLQATCPVRPDDTVDTLAARIHELEHRFFPTTIAQYLRFL